METVLLLAFLSTTYMVAIRASAVVHLELATMREIEIPAYGMAIWCMSSNHVFPWEKELRDADS